MTNALIVPPKVENSVKPPATKKEVIEALAIIKLKQITDENEDNRVKAEALKVECIQGVKAAVSLRLNALLESGEVNLGYVRSDNVKKQIRNAGINIELNDSNFSHALRRKLVEYHETQSKVRHTCNLPKLNDCRRMVSEMLNGSQSASERVKAMVDSPTVSKALTTLLRQLEDAPKNKQAITI